MKSFIPAQSSRHAAAPAIGAHDTGHRHRRVVPLQLGGLELSLKARELCNSIAISTIPSMHLLQVATSRQPRGKSRSQLRRRHDVRSPHVLSPMLEPQSRFALSRASRIMACECQSRGVLRDHRRRIAERAPDTHEHAHGPSHSCLSSTRTAVRFRDARANHRVNSRACVSSGSSVTMSNDAHPGGSSATTRIIGMRSTARVYLSLLPAVRSLAVSPLRMWTETASVPAACASAIARGSDAPR
eukprot:scaffold29581_cov55-Phaeocystis_antarctica.AAC.2